MTIETSNEHAVSFKDSEMDESIVWDEDQRADADPELEQRLADEYASISLIDDEDVEANSEVEDDASVEEAAADLVTNLEADSDVDVGSEAEADSEDE